MGGDRPAGELGGAFEVGRVIDGNVFGRRAGKQVVGKPCGSLLRLGGGAGFFFGLDFTLAMTLTPSRGMLLRLW
ncbi:hypothetical protein ACVDG8_021385 [Mesorhizobium sp. ORM8.1]